MSIEKKAIRKAFKDIGYKASFMNNPITGSNSVSLTFHGNGIEKPEHYSNVYFPSFHKLHKAAFDLLRTFEGAVLECSERKIRI